jgi:hypothetical protein
MMIELEIGMSGGCVNDSQDGGEVDMSAGGRIHDSWDTGERGTGTEALLQ